MHEKRSLLQPADTTTPATDTTTPATDGTQVLAAFLTSTASLKFVKCVMMDEKSSAVALIFPCMTLGLKMTSGIQKVAESTRHNSLWCCVFCILHLHQRGN